MTSADTSLMFDVDVPATLRLWYDLIERLAAAVERVAAALEART